MERWSLTISGTGSHHAGSDGDADRLAAEFVAMLRARGHTVESAKLAAAGAEHDVAELAHGEDFPAPAELTSTKRRLPVKTGPDQG